MSSGSGKHGMQRILEVFEGALPATPRNMRLAHGRPGIVAWSPYTAEEYSAEPGDYFLQPLDGVVQDSKGNPMVLVTKVVVIEYKPVTAQKN